MRQELPIFVLLTSAGRVLRVAPLTLAVIVACAPGVGDEAVEGGGTIDLVTAELSVPEGFRIEVCASGLPSVRTLKASPDGQLYAVLSEEGLIVRLDLTTPQASPYVVAEDLDRPYGLAFRGEDLYVGEEHQVVRLTGPVCADRGRAPPPQRRALDS